MAVGPQLIGPSNSVQLMELEMKKQKWSRPLLQMPMKILCHNCQVARNLKAINSLIALMQYNRPILVFPSKVGWYASEMDDVIWDCKLYGCIVIPPRGRAGGLAPIWKKEIVVFMVLIS